MKELMYEFWHSNGKKLLWQMIISGILITVAGIYLGYGEIALGVIEGYLLTFIYFFIMAFRLNRLLPTAVRRGKWEMWIGLVFRLVAVLVIVKLAFMKSLVVGYSTLGVFVWGFILVMGNVIHYNYKDVQ